MMRLPILRAIQLEQRTMNPEIQNTDVIDICELEYDVAGVGAEESSSEDNHAAYYIISYRLPENGV
jgi:hypothetical protein